MRTNASRIRLSAVALGCLLFAAVSLAAQQPVVTVFTDAFPIPPGDAASAEASPRLAAEMYCVYRIGAVQGNCGTFGTGSKLCIDCPASGKCPGPPGQLSRFIYVDAAGHVICQGDWARAFDLARPDSCIVCINGQTGFVFVD